MAKFDVARRPSPSSSQTLLQRPDSRDPTYVSVGVVVQRELEIAFSQRRFTHVQLGSGGEGFGGNRMTTVCEEKLSQTRTRDTKSSPSSMPTAPSDRWFTIETGK